MDAKAKSFTFLGAEGIVKIPFFQRDYCWTETNWEDMLMDLLEFEKSHFLGSLILKHLPKESGESPKVLVIDGQQRLTTLSILLRSLFNNFDKDTQNNCRQIVEGYLFYKKNATDSKLNVKIEHSKIDRKYYQQVIENSVDIESIDLVKEPNNILRCFKYFTEKLKSVSYDDQIELFNRLIDHENQILVVIDLLEKDDEQAIFDTINSAGVRLSGADIIKNALFQRAIDLYDNQEEVEILYKENWETIFSADEQSAIFWDKARSTGRLMRDNIEILLHSIAIIEKFFDPEQHSLSNLPSLYKSHINKLDRSALTNFIKSIARYARLFRDKMLVFDDKTYLFDFDDYCARLFHILSECEISTFHPYILFLYHKYEQNENKLKEEFLKLEKLLVRRMISNLATKNYNKMCKDFINDSIKIDVFIAETTDDSITAGLEKINNKNAALILFWVELYRRSKDSKYDHSGLKYVYSLEHIMPQKWEEYWSNVPVIDKKGNPILDNEKAKSYRNQMIYSIGNMTLLKSSLNTSLRNYEFNRKIEGEGRKKGIKAYAELGITKCDIVERFENGDKTWDESNIRERTARLNTDILAIW